MLADSHWRVRLRLAERLPLAAIACLIRDEDGDVQAVAAARLAGGDVETPGPGAERSSVRCFSMRTAPQATARAAARLPVV